MAGLDAGTVCCVVVGAVGQLMDDVIDGRERNGDVDVFIRADHVDLNLVADSGDLHVLFAVFDVNECGVRVLAQLGGDNLQKRQAVIRFPREMLEVLPGNKVQGYGYRGGGHPEMDVRAAIAMFVDVDTDDAFTESIDTRENDGTSHAQCKFGSENHRSFLPGAKAPHSHLFFAAPFAKRDFDRSAHLLVGDIFRVQPDPDSVVIALDRDQFGIAMGGERAQRGGDIQLVLARGK